MGKYMLSQLHIITFLSTRLSTTGNNLTKSSVSRLQSVARCGRMLVPNAEYDVDAKRAGSGEMEDWLFIGRVCLIFCKDSNPIAQSPKRRIATPCDRTYPTKLRSSNSPSVQEAWASAATYTVNQAPVI